MSEEEKKESCGCGCDCNCKSKCGRLLNNFFLVVIIVLLSGIFYSLQGLISMCPAIEKAHCMTKAKGAVCPMMHKGMEQAEK